jgi:hypothetical protein
MKTFALSVLGILAFLGPCHAEEMTVEDMAAYLERASRGEAGADPRDVKAARKGDPYAQARLRKRMETNRAYELERTGVISAEQAAARRQEAEQARQREDQRIELARIRMEIERQNQELERLRMERSNDRSYRR